MAVTSAWNRRVSLTVNHLKVTGDQTDFPVVFEWNGASGNIPDETYKYGSNHPKSDGGDIRFTSDINGSTELPFDLAEYYPNFVVANARVKIYVKIPSLSSANDTVIYMWWGNSSATAYAATDTYGRNNVWTNGYVGVFHLNELSGATAVNSVGGNDGTYNGATFPSAVDTPYGFMQNFVNANANFVSLGTGSPWNITGNMTLTANLYVSAFTVTWQALIAKGDMTYRVMRRNNYDYMRFDRTVTGGSSLTANTTAVDDSVYHNLAATFDTGVGTYLYIDGNAGDLTTNTTATSSDSKNLCIGRNVDFTARDWQGIIGEVRISDVARSSTWVSTNYNSEMGFSTFATPGTPEYSTLSTPLTGIRAAGTAGSVKSSLTKSATGKKATSAAGSVKDAITAQVTGEKAASAAGSVTDAVTVSLSGAQTSSAAGSVIAAVNIPATGNKATSATGSVEESITTPVTGNKATSAAGSVTDAVTVSLSGSQATSAAGSVIDALTASVTGNTATISAGSVGEDLSTPLTGGSINGNTGVLMPPGEEELTGINFTGATGNVNPEISENLTGRKATAGTGSVRIINGAICLASGYNISYHTTPGAGDVRIKLGSVVYGIPVIPATDDHAGSVRIKPNGTVKALQLIN